MEKVEFSKIREQLGKASLIALIVALFIQPILANPLISDAFFAISIVLASFGKGILRIMVFVLLAIIIIPFLVMVIFFGMGLDL